MRSVILLLWICSIIGIKPFLYGQQSRGEPQEIQTIQIPQMQVKQYDLTSNQILPFKNVADLGEKAVQLLNQLTPREYQSHPEYGLIPPTRACSNCIELIHERRPDMRVFVHVDTPSIKTYETVYGYLHYEDESGQLRTLSDEITFRSGNWVCTGASPFQRCLNLQTGEIKVNLLDNGFLRFGHETLLLVKDDGQVLHQETPNAFSSSFGIDGMLNTNYFSFANREAIIQPGGLKTNYVIPQPSPLFTSDFAYLVIVDTVYLPPNHQMIYNPSEKKIYIKNEEEEWIYGFYPPHLSTRKENLDKTFLQELQPLLSQVTYEVQSLSPTTFIYKIKVPKSILTTLPYPIVIDPLSTFYSPYYGNRMYFRYTRQGAQCWKPLGNYCGYSVTVNVPAPQGGTITSVRFEAQYIADWDLTCVYYMRDGAFKISGPCGISPPNNNMYWYCNSSNPGTCTADGSAAYEIFNPTTNCIAPACSYNLTYQIQNYDCYNCRLTGGCGGLRTTSSYLYHPRNTYRIILDLRTVENNATAEGSSGNVTVTCGDLPVDLCANPSYGVPAYTTTWYRDGSPIGSGNCITDNPPPGATVTYTAVTQDACGNTYSTNVTVNNTCTLPLEFTDIKIFRGQNGPLVKWAIGGTEEGSPSHFIIEKRSDQSAWEAIGKIPYTSGIHSYSFEDANPTPNTTLYYRVKLIYTDGQFITSKTVSYTFVPTQIVLKQKGNQLTIIASEESLPFYLDIYSADGKKVFSTQLDQPQTHISMENWANGIYYIKSGNTFLGKVVK